jgi:3-hydroxypropanoate dehydrogenase
MDAMLNQSALDTLFYNAHTHNGWQDRPVDDACCSSCTTRCAGRRPPPTARRPAGVCALGGSQGRLAPALSEGNLAKTLAAPVTVIVGMDMEFHESCRSCRRRWMHAWFAGNDAAIQATAFRNSSLQGGYLILAARALGLDVGRCRALTTPGRCGVLCRHAGQVQLPHQSRLWRRQRCVRARHACRLTRLARFCKKNGTAGCPMLHQTLFCHQAAAAQSGCSAVVASAGAAGADAGVLRAWGWRR